jgi:hypothetical protein
MATETTKLPAWYEDAAKEILALGKKRASLGYTPYMGPDVAAMDPNTLAGMQGFDAMSAAFGMPAGGAAGAAYLPQAQEYAGGVKGYSSFPGFEQAQKALKAKYPGIYDYLMSFSVDPKDTKISYEDALKAGLGGGASGGSTGDGGTGAGGKGLPSMPSAPSMPKFPTMGTGGIPSLPSGFWGKSTK